MRFSRRHWLAALTLCVPLIAAAQQNGGMSCAECHVNPLAGGVHGGFRNLSGMTREQVEVICLNCHDGSYTNPRGRKAPEAAVHQNVNPGEGRDEYGDFKATCLDCHTTHTMLLAGDGTRATKTISSPDPDPDLDEFHDVEPGDIRFFLDETSVTLGSIVLTDDQGVAFTEGVDYAVRTTNDEDPLLVNGDPRRINILSGGAIEQGAPLSVYAGYEFGGNQQFVGREVREADSADRLARIRRPIIIDTQADNGSTRQDRFEDDVHTGWACDSGIPDDPNCLPDDVREVVFHQATRLDGRNWAPTIVTFQPLVTDGPRNGACNACHTRTRHHRRNDLGEFGGGDDHTHNVDRPCHDCHNHKDGWVNKGG